LYGKYLQPNTTPTIAIGTHKMPKSSKCSRDDRNGDDDDRSSKRSSRHGEDDDRSAYQHGFWILRQILS
jgi:hypothetical protein